MTCHPQRETGRERGGRERGGQVMVETWHNVSVMINKCKIPSSPPVLVWLRHNNPSLHRADIILASHDTWPGSFIHSYFCLSKEFHLGQQSIEPFYFSSFIISPLGNIIIDKCTDPSGGPPPPPPPFSSNLSAATDLWWSCCCCSLQEICTAVTQSSEVPWQHCLPSSLGSRSSDSSDETLTLSEKYRNRNK